MQVSESNNFQCYEFSDVGEEFRAKIFTDLQKAHIRNQIYSAAMEIIKPNLEDTSAVRKKKFAYYKGYIEGLEFLLALSDHAEAALKLQIEQEVLERQLAGGLASHDTILQDHESISNEQENGEV